ncbi:SDR family oxidoreductase [Pseudokineococcus sp. 1T1Z-3]|uniref:SDR family oxidoreductase n=1 Tax=Pseudokineococcus sp. 1T1Z-3 TaxID=3132745 RepID=UPI003094A76E
MTKTTQNTFRNPVDAYAQPSFPEQDQSAPGLAQDMSPTPDHGEDTYVGSGRLADLVAVVTGADSGIGRAAAIAYAREGADVVLSYLPSEEEDAQQVVALVEAAGRKALAVPGDLSQEAANLELVDKAVEAFGRIDVLAVVAGKQTAVEDIADLTTEQFDETFRTNVHGLFWVVKAALPHMRPGASIITTSSVQAYQPSPSLLDYAPTKSAINTFSKALAQQLAPKGIRVNVVAPGPFWTALQVSGGQPPQARPEFGGQAPLARPGQPAELAATYVHLAAPESSYTTGATISVTGGMPTP